MSVLEFARCARCTNIMLKDLKFYALESLGCIDSLNCPECHFANVVQRYLRDIGLDITDESQIQYSLGDLQRMLISLTYTIFAKE